MRPFFFGNRFIIALNDLAPDTAAPPTAVATSPVKSAPAAPPSPDHQYGLEPAEPDDPWDAPKPNPHTLSWNGKSIYRDTPEWEDADATVKSHFGGKMGLHDLAAAYHLPGMKRQALELEHTPAQDEDEAFPYDPTNGEIKVRYEGRHPESKVPFNYELKHQIDDDGNHGVYWDWMSNKRHNYDTRKTETGHAGNLPNMMGRAIPAYQKAGIKYIDTHAVGGSSQMNGNHTWGTLGFGFSQPRERENAKYSANGMARNQYGHGSPEANELQTQIEGATHPFHFQKIAKQLARGEGSAARQKALYDEMVGEDFHGRLNLDPNDVGFQRMQRFIGHGK